MPRFHPVRDAASSLAALEPEAARLFVGDPTQVAARSNKIGVWRCGVEGSGHDDYERAIQSMTGPRWRPGGWCPQCRSAETSLAALYPLVADLLLMADPATISARSSRRYLWRCGVEGSGHAPYRALVNLMTLDGADGVGRCPECRKEQRSAA